MKSYSNTVGNRTCDLPAFGIVPQPTARPRAPKKTDIHYPAGVEPAVPASKQPQTHALQRTAARAGSVYIDRVYATRHELLVEMVL
jgi:hypothetical protein